MVAPLLPPAVHTAGVVVVNATARPEDAVAETVTGESVIILSASTPNAMVWSTFTNVYWSAAVAGLDPPGVVTVTSIVPAVWAGAIALIEFDTLTVNAAAGVAPNDTAVALSRSVPLMVTEVPPVTGPESGLTAVTAGEGITTFVMSNERCTGAAGL